MREVSITLSYFTDEETDSLSDLPQATQRGSGQLGLPQRFIPVSPASLLGCSHLPCQWKTKVPAWPKQRPSLGQAPQQGKGLLEKGSCTQPQGKLRVLCFELATAHSKSLQRNSLNSETYRNKSLQTTGVFINWDPHKNTGRIRQAPQSPPLTTPWFKLLSSF